MSQLRETTGTNLSWGSEEGWGFHSKVLERRRESKIDQKARIDQREKSGFHSQNSSLFASSLYTNKLVDSGESGTSEQASGI